MFSFIKRKLLYRFVIVHILKNSILVHTYDTKNHKVIDSDAKEFDRGEDEKVMPDEVAEFLNKKQEEVTRTYIVTTVNALGQGMVPTCESSRFKEYSVDRKYIFNICVDGVFSNFVVRAEIKWLQKYFSKTGIDLIYSPFTILKELSQEKANEDKILLHILFTSENSTILVTKNNRYLYGAFFSTGEAVDPLYSDFSDESDEDEEEFDVDDDFEIDDELDFDEFDEDSDDEDEDDEHSYKSDLELIESNKLFAQNLNKVLKEFYSNPLYEGSFIDDVFLYAQDSVDESIIEYIENELFLSVSQKKVDIDEEILELTYKEVVWCIVL